MQSSGLERPAARCTVVRSVAVRSNNSLSGALRNSAATPYSQSSPATQQFSQIQQPPGPVPARPVRSAAPGRVGSLAGKSCLAALYFPGPVAGRPPPRPTLTLPAMPSPPAGLTGLRACTPNINNMFIWQDVLHFCACNLRNGCWLLFSVMWYYGTSRPSSPSWCYPSIHSHFAF